MTNYKYEVIAPQSEYAPWHLDPEFCDSTWQTVGYTLVDMYRLWELWKLTEQVSKLPSGDILEVGTYKGGSGGTIAKQASICSPGVHVYLCDTFKGIVKCGEYETDACVDGQHVASLLDVMTVLSRLKVSNTTILEGIFPEDTGHEIDDLTFRLCHIDVDVYQSAKDVFDWVWPKLVTHGIIIFDDYGFRDCDGITKLVEDMMQLKDRLVIHNINGHAIIIKLQF